MEKKSTLKEIARSPDYDYLIKLLALGGWPKNVAVLKRNAKPMSSSAAAAFRPPVVVVVTNSGFGILLVIG